MARQVGSVPTDLPRGGFSSGVNENQLGRASGLRSDQRILPLIQNPQFWVSDSAGASGAAIANTSGQFVEFTFPAASEVADGNCRGPRYPFAVTPCIRYTAFTPGPNVRLEVEVEGFNQWGEYRTHRTPELVMANPTGSPNTVTYYAFMGVPFCELRKIRYRLSGADANDTMAIGVVHPVNIIDFNLPLSPAGAGAGGTNVAFYLGDPNSLADGVGALFSVYNYGIGAPVRMGQQYLPGPTGVSEQPIERAGEYEVISGWLMDYGAAAGGLQGTTAPGGMVLPVNATPTPDEVTVFHRIWSFGPYLPVDPTQQINEPLRSKNTGVYPQGTGGFIIGARETAGGRIWETDPDKIGLIGAMVNSVAIGVAASALSGTSLANQVAPFRDLSIFAGVNPHIDLSGGGGTAGVGVAPTVLNNYLLGLEFRTSIGTTSRVIGSSYPTRGKG